MTKNILYLQLLMHTPDSIPSMSQYGVALSPGTETFFSVTPNFVFAKQDEINKFEVGKRHCYFNGEKELSYFNHYSYLNCFAECVAKTANQVN